jgi:hypothetical protein
MYCLAKFRSSYGRILPELETGEAQNTSVLPSAIMTLIACYVLLKHRHNLNSLVKLTYIALVSGPKAFASK